MRLYHHQTDGGAEYLSDAFIQCANGHREGVFEGAKYVLRTDLESDVAIYAAAPEMHEALKLILSDQQSRAAAESVLGKKRDSLSAGSFDRIEAYATAALAKAECR